MAKLSENVFTFRKHAINTFQKSVANRFFNYQQSSTIYRKLKNGKNTMKKTFAYKIELLKNLLTDGVIRLSHTKVREQLCFAC